MTPLSHLDQIAFAELSAHVHAARRDTPYPGNGSFVKQRRGRRDYYYFKSYSAALAGRPGKYKLTYVGRADDQAVLLCVEEFARSKSLYRTRSHLASTLRAHGYPAPLPIEGEILAAFAEAGLFGVRAVLVGAVAFQCYAGMLSVAMPEAGYRTADLDLAQGTAVAVSDGEGLDVGALLREIDPSFSATFHPGNHSLPVGFANADGYRIAFLTVARRGREPVHPIRGLGPIGAQTLRFLEYLLDDARDGLVVHKAGIGVTVPAPERYAVHKLLIADLRRAQGSAKFAKDMLQVGLLLEAMALRRCLEDVGFAWIDACGRGSPWRKHLRSGWVRLPPAHREHLREGLRKALDLDDRGLSFEDLDPADRRSGSTRRSTDGG